jgi:glycosyltransferase involved in cell wall biosynthesis
LYAFDIHLELKFMKLFIIYGRQLDLFNGSNVHAIEVFNNLQKLGVDVFLFSKSSKKENFNNSNIIKVPSTHFEFPCSNYLNILIYQLSLFVYLLYYSIMIKPDLFYTRLAGNSISSSVVSSILKITQIGEVNGLTIDEMVIQGSSKFNINIAQVIEKINFNRCSKLIAVTRGVKKGLVDTYSIPESKIIVINNGANTDLFIPMDKNKIKHTLNLAISSHYICFVGNLIPWQGVEFLIKASPLILQKYDDARFLIVGDGIMRKELMQLAEDMGILDRFIFTGRVPYEDVPIYINASDICVAPFILERNSKIGLSALKTYEYLACGKPLVASGIAGVKELIEVSGGGISVTPEDPQELAAAVIKLLPDENTRSLMGKSGRRFVVENHSWYSVARKILDVCNKVGYDPRKK